MLSTTLRKLRRRLQGYADTDRLVKRGLEIGPNVYLASGAVVDANFPWLVSIGSDTTLGPGVYVLAHDASTRRHIGYTRVGRVKIGRRVFIGAYSLVLPGVTIGDDVIVGAGSVVREDVPAGVMVAGNPAVLVGKTEDYVGHHREQMERRPRFGRNEYTMLDDEEVSLENQRQMREALTGQDGYVR
ncbi:MAG: acyltransferase [Thermoleophilaceae bacterium]